MQYSNDEVTHQPCPHSDCDSSNAFAYNSVKMLGFCHSCDRSYPIKGMSLKSWAQDTYPLKDTRNMTPSAPVEIEGKDLWYQPSVHIP